VNKNKLSAYISKSLKWGKQQKTFNITVTSSKLTKSLRYHHSVSDLPASA